MFRNWIVQKTTFAMFGFMCFFLLLFMFMLTQTVKENDDLLNAMVFLTCSALPLMRVLYNYFDDHAINLNDYLYGAEPLMKMKAARLHHEDGQGARWDYLKYGYHIALTFGLHIAYGFAALWLSTRSSSPGYVAPFIAIVDFGVLGNLYYANFQSFNEVILAFSLVLFPRFLAVYLGYCERHASKPGAWEMVEPCIFLVVGSVMTQLAVDNFFHVPDKRHERLIEQNRYDQWVQRQREEVVKTRKASQANRCVHGIILLFSRVFLFSGGATHKSSVQRYSETIDLAHNEIVKAKVPVIAFRARTEW